MNKAATRLNPVKQVIPRRRVVAAFFIVRSLREIFDSVMGRGRDGEEGKILVS